jgi:hypothetical protein
MNELAEKVDDFEDLAKSNTIEVPSPEKELQIDIVDDRPEDDQKPSRASSDDVDEEIEGIGNRTKKRIDKLKYDYHEERRSKEQANRTRDEAVQFARTLQEENQALKGTVARSEEALVNSLKTRSTSEIEKAKSDYRQAYEAGDTDKLLEAQESLNAAFADKTYVENYVPTMNRQVQQQNGQQIPQQPQQPQVQEPQLDPKAIEYIRNNDWFEREGNEDMTALAYGMHAKLVRQGIDPVRDSEKYYGEIDNAVKNRFPERFPESNTATAQTPSTVVAPANRSGTKQRTVQLTRTQVDLARRLGLTPEQYATQFMKEQSNG